LAVTRINHFNISVRDMDEALRFWEEGLELPLKGRGRVRYPHLDVIVGLPDSDIEWAELALPDGALIELFRYHSPTGEPVDPSVQNPGTTHLCLEVDDLDDRVRRLRSLGYPPVSDPVTIPFGDWAGWLCVYLREANGVTIELVQSP
jgi:catechol 2,3-dioxygenase-like lactoylglutathione lyase family enzyme